MQDIKRDDAHERPSLGVAQPLTSTPFGGPVWCRAIWDASDDAMVLTDRGGTVVAANPAYCALHRFSPGELIGRSLSLIVPEPERPFAISQYRAAFEGLDADESHRTVAHWRDGSGRVVESRIDLLMRGNHREAMMSTVRVIREAPPVEKPHPLPAPAPSSRRARILKSKDSDELTQTTADVLIAAIHKWGIDAVLGLPGEGGIRAAPL